MSRTIKQFKSKFSELTEQAVSRFEQGGYINGDYVKLRDNYKSSDFYKNASETIKSKLDEIAASDLNLRVSAVKSIRPRMAPVVGNLNAPTDFYLDIAMEIAPGLYPSHVTVPQELVQMVDTADAMGRMTPPESQVYKANIHGAEEVETNDKDRNLPQKDTKLKAANKWQDSPGGGNAPKKTIFERKTEESMLEEAYTSIYEQAAKKQKIEAIRQEIASRVKEAPDGEEIAMEETTIEEGAEATSILTDIINDVYEATDIETAKNIAVSRIKDSRIPDQQKRQMLFNISKINDLVRLQTYLTNSMLKKRGMGSF